MSDFLNIWVWVHHREGALEEETFGLIAEANRLISGRADEEKMITAVALGSGLHTALAALEDHGTDRVIYVEDEVLNHYHGELFAHILHRMVKTHRPSSILMAQNAETADLAPRLAAMLETALVTRAMDLKKDHTGPWKAIRPRSNGYLFEKIVMDGPKAPIVTFNPSVLTGVESVPGQSGREGKMDLIMEPMDINPQDLETRVLKVIEAAPEDLDLEEADIIVSGGRGVGKGPAFDIIHELADLLGGSVGGTRPVIDWKTLPYERQIGQTGKVVSPGLLINCGISGANEYTAGIEKSKHVIAIDQDPGARIFRFSDLGVIGDVHEIIPILIERIKGLNLKT